MFNFEESLQIIIINKDDNILKDKSTVKQTNTKKFGVSAYSRVIINLKSEQNCHVDFSEID